MEASDISYERDIHNSYLIIKAIEKENFEEKILLQRNIEGLLPMKKCFTNGKGEYWYNISGKQALDNYCSIETIGKELFVTLISRLCDQLEILEWNLLDASSLDLRPEMIFLRNQGKEVFFLLNPQNQGDIFSEIQKWMEYLLTKLDHADKELVYIAYQLYEVMLVGQYNISDLRKLLMDQSNEHFEVLAEETVIFEEKIVEQEETFFSKIYILIKEQVEKIRKGWSQEEQMEDIPDIVYPDEEDVRVPITVHPTVCLSMNTREPRGVLLYEGKEGYPDFEIGTLMCIIGKSHRVKLQLDKDTISQFHAKVEYRDGTYYIEDMNSTNGTYLNEEMLNYKEQRALNPGDVIRFADVKYRFM